MSWRQDPTIQSMLTMLDAIHEQFKDSEGYFSKLTDLDQPVITFLFLNLDDFKLTDDLYIKMNSRGKSLTEFENFKAQLEKKMQTFTEDWGAYQLSFSSQEVSGAEYFAHKIDTDWANLFWFCWGKGSAFDRYLMTFIQLSLANYTLLRDSRYDQDLYRKLFVQGSQVNTLSFIEHDQLGAISQPWAIDLMRRLDLLLAEQSAGTDELATYLNSNPYYDEKAVFKKIGANESSLIEKLRFHALYTALIQGKKDQELLAWMRVIFNLTENSVVEGGEEYHRALCSIDALAKEKTPILTLLTRGTTITGFSGAQLLEERIKAHLLLRSSVWKASILELEQHAFFKGQIGFALRFSGVVNYFELHKQLAWSDAEDFQYLKRFKRYAAAATAVFHVIAKDSAALDYLWERAVLSKGNYLTAGSANRYNLLSTRTTKNNVNRDHSWHRLLRLGLEGAHDFKKWQERQGYVQEVWDDPDFDPENLEKSLGKIAYKVVPEPSMAWQHMLIHAPQLFKLCSQGFVMLNSNETILLHESQRNHYHSELYTRFLEIELQRLKVDIYPFSVMHYVEVRSANEYALLQMSDYVLQEQSFNLDIYYSDERYELCFCPSEMGSYPNSLTACLRSMGFITYAEWVDYDPEYYADLAECYVLWCDSYTEAIALLKELCSKLKALE